MISVVVPVYNGADSLRACLTALYASTNVLFEVIVVDDGSTDNSSEIASAFPCRVITAAHLGAAAARNAGATHATGAVLFFLDADILVKPDSLAQIESTLAGQPDVVALFGSYERETVPTNFVSVYKNLLHHYTHQTADANAVTFCGGFGAIRREAFNTIGGFDVRQRFLEDIDLGYRLHQQGATIRLARDLQFTHCKRYTLVSLIRSDVVARAIPWTRLMLAKSTFRNDLNTRTHNVLSVPLSFVLLANIVALLARWVTGSNGRMLMASAFALAAVLIFINGRFIRYLAEVRGVSFAIRGMLMLWLGYLYSGVGAAIGLLQHLSATARGQRRRLVS